MAARENWILNEYGLKEAKKLFQKRFGGLQKNLLAAIQIKFPVYEEDDDRKEKDFDRNVIGRFLQKRSNSHLGVKRKNFIKVRDTLWEKEDTIPPLDEIADIVLKPKEKERIRFGVPNGLRTDYFTGRRVALDTLHHQLTENPVAGITGLGGMGKTQTAVEYAFLHFYDQQNYDYVFWVNASEKTLKTGFAKLAVQLALPVFEGTQDKQIADVRRWMANYDKGQWLLIFDNADDPKQLVDFMPNNPMGKVLITSRVTALDRLNITQQVWLNKLSEEEATEFLFLRTKYSRTDENCKAVIELNHKLDGLPLALEQSGAFMSNLPNLGFRRYLKKYEDTGLALLDESMPETGQYPDSVLITWNINFKAVNDESPASIDLLKFSAFLSPDEIPYRILLKGASHLGETLSDILSLEDEDDAFFELERLLHPLDKYSLIKVLINKECYSIHQLVQSVVRDNLSAMSQNSWIDKGISALDAINSIDQPKEWWENSDLFSHWETICNHARLQSFESESLGYLLLKIGIYFGQQGYHSLTDPFFVESLEILKKIVGYDNVAVAGNFHNIGENRIRQKKYSEAESMFKKAKEINQKLFGNDHSYVATNMTGLAKLYRIQGRYDDAEKIYNEALNIYKLSFGNDDHRVALLLNNLARMYHDQHNFRESEILYRESMQTYINIYGCTHTALANVFNNLGYLYLDTGYLSEAEKKLKLSIGIYLKVQELHGFEYQEILNPLNNLLFLFRITGRLEEARYVIEEIKRIERDVVI